ncbi:Wtf16 [Schizosaccharomyces pombe]
MKNNYTSLKSSIDEEDELKTDHEIDLEKGLLPEYNSEEESTLPPYSERPGVLKRMRNTTGNVIGYICEGIGNIGDAFRRIGNAFRGANDNNNIPLGEIDVEIEV